MILNKVGSIITNVLDTAHNYGNFDQLHKTGDAFGQLLSSLVNYVQTYIWIPVGFVALLSIICFIGNKKGKEWAMGKFKDIVIVIGAIIFFVYLLTAIMSAFGYGQETIDNITNTFNGTGVN